MHACLSIPTAPAGSPVNFSQRLWEQEWLELVPWKALFPLPTYTSALKTHGCKAKLCKWDVGFLTCCFGQTLSTSPGGCPSAQQGLLPEGKK